MYREKVTASISAGDTWIPASLRALADCLELLHCSVKQSGKQAVTVAAWGCESGVEWGVEATQHAAEVLFCFPFFFFFIRPQDLPPLPWLLFGKILCLFDLWLMLNNLYRIQMK